MTCEHCRPGGSTPSEIPFRISRCLSHRPHEGVGLGGCSFCGEACIHYWVEIYDDYWEFWCVPGAGELEKLADHPPEKHSELHDQVREMIRNHVVLQIHPLAGPMWVEGRSCFLCGPPW